MNIYEKLQNMRVELQGTPLKKSGHNKYSDYDYFEMGDFLPTINILMLNSKLCPVVSFNAELATLTIINSERPEEKIVITSPMAGAQLKACHEIQNMGAVETYQRRYLYMAALEIVENDVLDGTAGKDKPTQKTRTAPAKQAPPAPAPAPVQQTPVQQTPVPPEPEHQEKANGECSVCGIAIKPAVVTYSEKNYGKKLCYNCQSTAAKAS